MNELVVEVCGGLCNRLRVLISANYLAERYGRKLILCWRPTDTCGARFGDLFTNAVTETDSMPGHPPPLDGRLPGAVARAVQSPERIVCVSECHWLVDRSDYPRVIPHFLALHPVAAVTRAVDAISAEFHCPAMGVHVRRGDFGEFLSRRHNSDLPGLERYFAYLDGWKGTIFLATDGGEEVIGRFRERYGNRVAIHPPRCEGRNTPQAIQDALVDVYLLQRCQAVIGTQYSSFSELARVITGAPHAKVTDREASLFARLKFSSRIRLSRLRRRVSPGRGAASSLKA